MTMVMVMSMVVCVDDMSAFMVVSMRMIIMMVICCWCV